MTNRSNHGKADAMIREIPFTSTGAGTLHSGVTYVWKITSWDGLTIWPSERRVDAETTPNRAARRKSKALGRSRT